MLDQEYQRMLREAAEASADQKAVIMELARSMGKTTATKAITEPAPQPKPELRIGVGTFQGKISIAFEGPVQVVLLDPRMARALADRLRQAANELAPMKKRHKK